MWATRWWYIEYVIASVAKQPRPIAVNSAGYFSSSAFRLMERYCAIATLATGVSSPHPRLLRGWRASRNDRRERDDMWIELRAD